MTDIYVHLTTLSAYHGLIEVLSRPKIACFEEGAVLIFGGLVYSGANILIRFSPSKDYTYIDHTVVVKETLLSIHYLSPQIFIG